MRTLGCKGVNPNIIFCHVYIINIATPLPLSMLSEKEMVATEIEYLDNQEFRDFYKHFHCFKTAMIATLKSHIKTLGFYNFIRFFGWAYKPGEVTSLGGRGS